MTTERWDVRVKPEGAPAFTWTNVAADHPHRAIAEAFAEDYWPETWEDLPWAETRFRVTVTARGPDSDKEKL